MEACGSASFWGRKFQAMGHTVTLIPPQYVKPFVRTNKNDWNDAHAIAEASLRPSIPTVPIKTQEAQDLQSLHRARQLVIEFRTATINHIRGILAESGIVLKVSATKVEDEAEEQKRKKAMEEEEEEEAKRKQEQEAREQQEEQAKLRAHQAYIASLNAQSGDEAGVNADQGGSTSNSNAVPSFDALLPYIPASVLELLSSVVPLSIMPFLPVRIGEKERRI